LRGKGNRQDKLPLPSDVGQSLAAYLRRARPSTSSRRVFLRHPAPHGPLSPSAITAIVHQACDRRGIPRFGSHRLRHTAATRMLAGGASLPEIAQVLRHKSLATTAIYAKVDRHALRALALPWPGGKP
jgi:site-specific recombinase XerD